MAILEGDNGVGLFYISNCKRNLKFLVKMRGQPTFDDLPLARYDYTAKMAILEGDNGVGPVQYFNLQWKCANSG